LDVISEVMSTLLGQRMRFHAYDQNPSKIVRQSPQDLSPTFDSIGLKNTVCDAIQSMDITEPTAIQKATIPSILDYKNVICSAETGSGKTIAYLAPIIQLIREFKEQKLEQTSGHLPKGLVVVPSRELAEQVGRVAQHLGTYCGIGVAVMMGGPPKHISHTGMDLIVSTIGLIQPLIQKRNEIYNHNYNII
jgi:superfamily II DNA/RNA helicase